MQISNHCPQNNKQSQKKLWERYCSGDNSVYYHLYKTVEYSVLGSLKVLCRKFPNYIEDALSEAHILLMEQIHNWDPQKATLEKYVYYLIYQRLYYLVGASQNALHFDPKQIKKRNLKIVSISVDDDTIDIEDYRTYSLVSDKKMCLGDLERYLERGYRNISKRNKKIKFPEPARSIFIKRHGLLGSPKYSAEELAKIFKIDKFEVVRNLRCITKMVVGVKNCKQCKKEFPIVISTATFCGNKCRRQYHEELNKKAPVIQCQFCLKEFPQTDRQLYCSDTCRKSAKSQRLRGSRKKMTKNCNFCTNKFETFKIKQIFCSKKCCISAQMIVAKKRRNYQPIALGLNYDTSPTQA